MKKFLKKYRATSRAFAVALMAFALCNLGLWVSAVALLGVFQLLEIAMSKSCGALYNTVLTPEQVKEFEKITAKCGEFITEHTGLFKDVKDLGTIKGGFAELKKLPELLDLQGKTIEQLQASIKKLNKQLAMSGGGNQVRWVNGVPFVTDGCALALSGMFLGQCAFQKKWTKSLGDQDEVLARAAEWVGVEKTALTSSDIPLPTIYVGQVVELVYAYGQFRQYSTKFPLGAGTVNLPKLTAGESTFGLIAASGSVGEKTVGATNVTFTAQKVGGIIRIPSEIEEDTFIALGQFLARYIARQMALFEDNMGFLGDNTATYNRYGVGPYIASIAQTPQLVQLAANKTKPSDATIADFRLLRTKVNAAVLQQGQAAYYLHPSMEALLVTFNTVGAPLIYQRQNGSAPATLDGFPIRWVGVMQPYTTAAAASAYLAFFGDLTYWYLGERGAPRIETSRDVYFATDEVGMRALERIDVQAMATDAMSALQTGAGA